MLLTSFGRVKRMTERAAARLPTPVDVLELDVNRPEDLAALAESLRERWGEVDGVLHAIAFAPQDALGGKFMTAPADSAAAGVHDQRVLAQGAGGGAGAADASGSRSSGWTSTRRWRGRSTTGWASPRPRSSRSHDIWPGISARAGSASTWCRPGRSGPSRRRGSPASSSSRSCGESRRRSAGTPTTWCRSPKTICWLLSDYLAADHRRDRPRRRRLSRGRRADRLGDIAAISVPRRESSLTPDVLITTTRRGNQDLLGDGN